MFHSIFIVFNYLSTVSFINTFLKAKVIAVLADEVYCMYILL